MGNNKEANPAQQGGEVKILAFSSNLMSRREAALYLGIAEQTLAIWKTTGRYNLPVVKIGRLAKYRKSDLDAFIARRVQGG